MSKRPPGNNIATPTRMGEWLRELREGQHLPLRVVADAVRVDLAHLNKVELGQRLPTEEQTSRLAAYFNLDETQVQARRIAEKFRQEFAENPAAPAAISILAEEAATYGRPQERQQQEAKRTQDEQTKEKPTRRDVGS